MTAARPVDKECDDAELIVESYEYPETFALLFDRYADDIHRYAARRVGTGHADDIVAETFLVAFRRRASYDATRRMARPWLYGIATNLLARHRREEERLYRALQRTGIDPLPEPIGGASLRSSEKRTDHRNPGPGVVLQGTPVANVVDLADRAAQAARTRPFTAPKPQQWIYIQTRSAPMADPGEPNGPVAPHRRHTTAQWIRADGKQEATIDSNRKLTIDNLLPAEPRFDYPYLSSLPTDPDRLLAALRASADEPVGPRDVAVFSNIGVIMRNGLIPPQVQAALFQVLPRLKGVQLVRQATDAAGRTGIAFAITEEGYLRDELILDSRTYRYLGERSIVIKNHVSHGDDGDLHSRKGEIVEWAAQTRIGVVDKPGQQP